MQTGKLPLKTTALVAILSLSLVVNLPGLAVSPMLGSLSEIFPKTTQLEKQLLTLLPNLVIIPFVLLSGKLSLSRHKIAIVVSGLILFGASAVAYMFAKSMLALIVISCFLGGGAGMIIPFSTGLLADTFAGKYRMKMMGWQSGISNITLVCATFAVGWLSHGNWHLPFVVYFVFAFPLLVTPWLHRIPEQDLDNNALKNFKVDLHLDAKEQAHAKTTKSGFLIWRLVGTCAVYFFITYATIVISYYCPFLVEKRDWNSDLAGTVTSLYFLFIFICGFALPRIVKVFKQGTSLFCAICMLVGLACFVFIPAKWSMCVGSSLIGLGYGTLQPIIYDKATRVVTDQSKSTLSLALILSSNYVAIVCTPFIVDGFRALFHAEKMGTFAFVLNLVLMAAFLILVIFMHKNFVFRIPQTYYMPDDGTSTPGNGASSSSSPAPAAASPAPAAATATPAAPATPSSPETKS